MSRELERYKGDTNRDVIELYLVSEEGKVELNDQQKKLLQRWQYADELIRKNEMRRETIARMIMVKFLVSRMTAYQDIVQAENVFASSTPLNKKYRVQLRIEFLEMKINELYGEVEPDPDDPKQEDELEKIFRRQRNSKYILEAIQLEKVLKDYYKLYPDVTPPRSPKTIVFKVVQDKLPQPALSILDAMNQDGHVIDITPIEGDDDESK